VGTKVATGALQPASVAQSNSHRAQSLIGDMVAMRDRMSTFLVGRTAETNPYPFRGFRVFVAQMSDSRSTVYGVRFTDNGLSLCLSCDAVAID
jgi:hypothetical protein